jgi:hypothetical protein
MKADSDGKFRNAVPIKIEVVDPFSRTSPEV